MRPQKSAFLVALPLAFRGHRINISLMTTTEQRIAKASRIMGRAVAKLVKDDRELARRLSDLIAAEMDALRK